MPLQFEFLTNKKHIQRLKPRLIDIEPNVERALAAACRRAVPLTRGESEEVRRLRRRRRVWWRRW